MAKLFTIEQKYVYDEVKQVMLGAIKILEIQLDDPPNEFARTHLRGCVRHYDPYIGTFTSKDPLLFGGGQANLYGYSFNDPINFIDPIGLDPNSPSFGQHFNQLGTTVVNAVTDPYNTYTKAALGVATVGLTAAASPAIAAVVMNYCLANPEACNSAASGLASGLTGETTGMPTLNPTNFLANLAGKNWGKTIKEQCDKNWSIKENYICRDNLRINFIDACCRFFNP